MKDRKILITGLLSVALGLWLYHSQVGAAKENAGFVGSEVCAMCHAEVSEEFAHTTHRAVFFNDQASKHGCEACHGPGAAHVASGGDPADITRLSDLKPTEAADICMSCHTSPEITMWHTDVHAQAKLSCINCHDPHQPGEQQMLRGIRDATLEVEGLSKQIADAELSANTAPPGSEERASALRQVETLRAQRALLRAELQGRETAYRKSTGPYVCYQCHTTQQIQARMPSRHPFDEGKMKCSDCHNPHGGLSGNAMLREESVSDTCAKCHAEKIGPFTFEHPPVTEDCTSCHNPHGSVHNNLLVQNEPFLCLKCHAGPHSRNQALGSPSYFANYQTTCTECHTMIHGSDTRYSFRH